MVVSKLKIFVASLVLFAVSGAAFGQGTLTRRDTEAAGAVWGQMISVETMINYCERYVAEMAKAQLPMVLANWKTANQDYMTIAEVIRNQILAAVTAAQGEEGSAEWLHQAALSDQAAQAEIRFNIDANPPAQREGKCYGIMIAVNQGQFDVWEALPEDAQHIADRVEEMGWLN